MNNQPLTYRETAWFFFPLVLNVQLMSISHTIINSFLARLDDYVTALAGMSVAMIIHVFLSSPSYQNHTITLVQARGRKSTISVLAYICTISTYVAVLVALVAFTSAGDLVFGLLGTPPEVVTEARRAMRIMVVLPFISGFRFFCQGMLLRIRRTGLISFATGIRAGSLFLYLALGSLWFGGAQLGGFALVSCIATETLVICLLLWRVHPVIENDGPEKSFRDILKYGLPLAYSSCLQQAIPLLISGIIGRFSDGAMALAAFGVIRGLVFLLAGPMRNLQQAHLALVNSPRDSRLLFRFSLVLATTLSILFLLAAGPLDTFILGRLLGVEAELSRYMRLGLALCAIFPFFYGASHLLRGWFSGVEKTALLGKSTIMKCLFILLLWWPLVAWQPPVAGITIAILLLVSSEILEAGYLFMQRLQQRGPGSPLVPR